MAQLVTLIGGSGFIGRYVAQALLRADARVRIVSRNPHRAFYLRPQGNLGQLQFIAGDLTKPDTIARAVRESDAVVNLVGVLSGPFERVHVDGARTVAEAAHAAGARALVHVSAIGADSASPSAYGRTKAAGEAAVAHAFPGATIIRPSLVFGPEDALTNRFARMMQLSPVVPVLAGATRFQPVFAGDLGRAIAAAASDPGRHAGRTYEIGGPATLSMAELNRLIARIIGRKTHFVELPDGMGAGLAKLGFLPGAPLTQDQWQMLSQDNVPAPGAEGLAAFGLDATPLEAVAEGWLVKYRRLGRFGAQRKTA
ncbi:complex I NDUFA9 subunit family protein [Sphingomonas morindae]|uniref:Complex I NDUFA9 subunit family protein n=1 Tax=Sphingomonas morindae TaxID=1541170 RepID=A0ABY4XAU6_9SPHN|nr:complex I NDUFA9 subunit family protein [Sphingomonas morindae]USI74048.1 complex I NDUFA9 subunit family protein [Sphingomonas morindae]